MNRQAGPDSVMRGSGDPTQPKRQPLLNADFCTAIGTGLAGEALTSPSPVHHFDLGQQGSVRGQQGESLLQGVGHQQADERVAVNPGLPLRRTQVRSLARISRSRNPSRNRSIRRAEGYTWTWKFTCMTEGRCLNLG
jgi:hypothetical protein